MDGPMDTSSSFFLSPWLQCFGFQTASSHLLSVDVTAQTCCTWRRSRRWSSPAGSPTPTSPPHWSKWVFLNRTVTTFCSTKSSSLRFWFRFCAIPPACRLLSSFSLLTLSGLFSTLFFGLGKPLCDGVCVCVPVCLTSTGGYVWKCVRMCLWVLVLEWWVKVQKVELIMEWRSARACFLSFHKP